ncbi:MAG: SLBB domain-containing protein, partial [Candidatus Acidiferrales bacterium]
LSDDLSRFAASPDDIEVRAGDRIVIPKNPNVVIVTGQVYNPNALTFRPRKNANWYLERAGGPTTLAEKKNIFIVRANGEVVSGNSDSWWGGGVLSTKVEPGDTIVVPEKAIGGSTFWRNFVAIAQVASSAAIGYAVATR